ncbi:MAG: GGDEF domain-containing protein [Rhodocyclales bacterium]|nr:GGDEF domain-containing protein [Rhodocyclales bacterium]
MQAAPTPTPDAGPVPDVELLVREDKLKLLFRQSFPALFISFATALLLSWMLWGHASDVAILAWLAVLAVSTLGRLAVFLVYFRTKPAGVDLLKLERRYVFSLMVSSLIWGFGALLVMPANSLVHQAITLFILVGMAGGAISMYSARYLMAIGAMTSVLLPSTIWLYTQPGKEQLGMALGATLFMAVLVRAAKVLANALQENFQLSRELHAAHAAADQQAKTDALTGINNRRAFLDHGEQLIRYCERHELALSAMVMDLDHFKSINDSLGHLAGDTVLRQVGEIILTTLRRSDVCGRIGGEEFAVILPHTSENAALGIAEKLRRTIAETPIVCGERRLEITISIGVASGAYDLGALLAFADKAMYRAKAQGRNQVVRYEDGFVA